MTDGPVKVVIGPSENEETAVTIGILLEVVEVINRELLARSVLPRLEWGNGENCRVLFLRHVDGTREARDLTGARGRQGRRGRTGPVPRHEWNETRTRIRFENADGSWGEWSADLRGGDKS